MAMSVVVTARFESFATAKSAAHALFAEGFREDAVNIFYVGKRGLAQMAWAGTGPPSDVGVHLSGSRSSVLTTLALLGMFGAVAGAGAVLAFRGSDLALSGAAALGAFLASLIGALWITGRGRLVLESGERRSPDMLMTVQIHNDGEDLVIELLRDAGGSDVDRVKGRWSHGSWIESDPRVVVPRAGSVRPRIAIH
jgi:hypothetical protein